MLSYIFLSEVQKVLDRKAWTQKKLADEIGTSASYLTQLLRGDRLLNLKTVAKIEDALNIRFEIKALETKGNALNYPNKKDLELDQAQVNES